MLKELEKKEKNKSVAFVTPFKPSHINGCESLQEKLKGVEEHGKIIKKDNFAD